MQTIERDVQLKSGAIQSPYTLTIKDGRAAKAAKPGCGKGRDDDCSAYDKLPKKMDDIVEGESPKRFKRPKTDCDIVAR